MRTAQRRVGLPAGMSRPYTWRSRAENAGHDLIGTTKTIVLGHVPSAAEVRAVIDGPFDVTWFGEADRWTVAAATAHVFLDYDPHFGWSFAQHLSDQKRAAVSATAGGRPRLSLHAHISTATPGSAELADAVIRHILGRWPGAVDPCGR